MSVRWFIVMIMSMLPFVYCDYKYCS